MYNMGELAKKMEVPPEYITAIRKVGAPIPFGRSHPTLIMAWLMEHGGDESMRGPLMP